MEKFKNSIVMVCVCIGVVLLEVVFMPSQTTPQLIIKVFGLIFFGAKCIGIIGLILAILSDSKNYLMSRY